MKSFQKIIIDDIHYLKSLNKKILMVFTTGQQSLISMSLSRFEEKTAENKQFIRINRQYIINRNFIQKVEPNKIIMQNGDIIKVKVSNLP